MECSIKEITKKISETKGKNILMFADAKLGDVKLLSEGKEATYVVIYQGSKQKKNTIENNIIIIRSEFPRDEFIKHFTNKFDKVFLDDGIGSFKIFLISHQFLKKKGQLFLSEKDGDKIHCKLYTEQFCIENPFHLNDMMNFLTEDNIKIFKNKMFETYEIISLSYPFSRS